MLLSQGLPLFSLTGHYVEQVVLELMIVFQPQPPNCGITAMCTLPAAVTDIGLAL